MFKTQNIKHHLILLYLSTSIAALPSINISPGLTILSQNQKFLRITIKNNNPYKSYLKMMVVEQVCHPLKTAYLCAKHSEHRTKLSQQLKFSHSRFILNPGQSRTLFARWKGPLPTRAVMLRFYAENHAFESIKTIQRKTKNIKNEPIIIKLKVRVVYQARIFVHARNTQQKTLKVVRKKNHLTLMNPGNTPLFIRAASTCKKNKTKCAITHLRNTPPKDRMMMKPKSKFKFKIKPNQIVQMKYFNDKTSSWTNVKTPTT